MTTLADANTAPTGIAINPSLGRQSAATTRSVNLSNEDYAALQQLATLLSGTLTVTANVGTGTQPVSGTITANAGTGTMAVSLASLPALATGANVIGGVTQSGTWNITNISGTISLPTGAATSANQSTLNTNIGSSADAVVANGVAGSIASYLRTIKDQATSTASSSVTIDQTTPGTTNGVVSTPSSAAYALIPAPSTYRLLSAAATTNGANIKASAGAVKGIQGFNAKASAVYLKLYNKATAPTVGTDTPVKTIYLPASAAFALDFGTGVGFTTGISIALTGAGADADTTALASGDILALNVDYH